ncbi:MAG: flagellar FlbD family protein [Acidobacteriota bacterium]
MILLTRINGTPLAMNTAHVLWVEKTPDTVITLINGDRIRVREGLDEVVHAFRRNRSRILDAEDAVTSAIATEVSRGQEEDEAGEPVEDEVQDGRTEA